MKAELLRDAYKLLREMTNSSCHALIDTLEADHLKHADKPDNVVVFPGHSVKAPAS